MLSLFVLTLFASKLEITTSILPQKYFIEKIGGEKVNVNAMVLPGFSPHTYEPKISQMKQLSSSNVYFYIGVSFENVWLDKFKAANVNLRMVDMAQGIEKISMQEHDHEDEHEKNRHEEALDPHVWLDPILVKTLALNIYTTLVELDSLNREYYKKNYDLFINEIDVFYKELQQKLEPVHGKSFMVFHPSWGYFAQRFHLEQISVEVEGKEPKPNQLVELIQKAQEHNIQIIFVAPEFSQKSAKVIASSIKGKVVPLSSLNENWKETLLQAANAIVSSLQK
jgi:zinc transport system substrate-binding protein